MHENEANTENIGRELAQFLQDDQCRHKTVSAIEILYTAKRRTQKWRKVWLRDNGDMALAEFLANELDQDYESGYGTQQVDGTVWFDDNSWLERREYDGSEWWELCECPPLPTRLEK